MSILLANEKLDTYKKIIEMYTSYTYKSYKTGRYIGVRMSDHELEYMSQNLIEAAAKLRLDVGIHSPSATNHLVLNIRLEVRYDYN